MVSRKGKKKVERERGGTQAGRQTRAGKRLDGPKPGMTSPLAGIIETLKTLKLLPKILVYRLKKNLI